MKYANLTINKSNRTRIVDGLITEYVQNKRIIRLGYIALADNGVG